MVVLHVLTSVGWLTMALTQVTLMLHAMTVTDAQTRQSALTMTEFIDRAVLQTAATGSAYTGLMLCALTSWGFFRFTWVAAKLAVTIGGLYLGIAHLGQWLHAGVLASETGGLGPVNLSVYWASALIVALVFASWLSVAKPWGRIRPARRVRREPDAHPGVWVAALLVPFVDYLLHLQGALMLATVLGYAGYRCWRQTRSPARPKGCHPPRMIRRSLGSRSAMSRSAPCPRGW